MGATTAVAKKKGKPGPVPNPDGPRTALVAIKCHVAWKAWLSEFAESERITPSYLLDIAAAHLAEEKGFRAPPKR